MSSRAQLNRREFRLFMGRVFAPYAHFRRNPETGSYLNHSVQVAWCIWEAAQYSPYRPLVDGFGERIEKGTSRRKRRPLMTQRRRGAAQ